PLEASVVAKKKANPKKKKATSSLGQHKRIGKTLVPPLLTVPNLSRQSWADDRLPEMLWACLVISVLPRPEALDVFREIASLGFKYRTFQGIGDWTLGHSQLPSLPKEVFERIVSITTRHPLGYAALRPLLLLDSLPGREQWAQALATDALQEDWQTLARAVLATLPHQSQEATDVRWLSLLFRMALGVLYFPVQMKHLVEEIVEYPTKGDLRAVRPFIRAAEMSFSMQAGSKSTWSNDFWSECLDKTDCVLASPPAQPRPAYDRAATVKRITEVYAALQDHWFATLATTAVDPRHDTAFGFGFYALAIILEMMSGLNAYGIAGRTLLRALSECRITLAYLRTKDSDELWRKYREYGTGQAKLALLKLDELTSHKPGFVSQEVLETLSNDDFFQEYVKIEMGHWCGLDLRKMAEASGTKSDYDAVYGWASAYIHGHWSALRDACMTHCLNPLHRVHRVPMPGRRVLEDTLADGIRLANSVLEDVGNLYPDFPARIALVAKGESPPETGENKPNAPG
ncbi:MAG: DUF5677 domain-containing protein, partial [Thermodesulfobacteriota bacterium]